MNPGPRASGMTHESRHMHTHVGLPGLWVHSNEGRYCSPCTCPRMAPHHLTGLEFCTPKGSGCFRAVPLPLARGPQPGPTAHWLAALRRWVVAQIKQEQTRLIVGEDATHRGSKRDRGRGAGQVSHEITTLPTTHRRESGETACCFFAITGKDMH